MGPGRRSITFIAMALAWCAAIVACSSSTSTDEASPNDQAPSSSTPAVQAEDAEVPADEPTSVASTETSELIRPDRGASGGAGQETVELTQLSSGDGPTVSAAVYPRPDTEGDPWSQWGQGLLLEDGRVLTAIGDHLGADGNSFLFAYDPNANTLTRFGDVLSSVEHDDGEWGYGKVHGQLVDVGDGHAYFSTYYGSRRGLAFGNTYNGDVLFRIDTSKLTLEPVAVPVAERGVPSVAGANGLVFGEFVDPLPSDPDNYPTGGFFVYDAVADELRFSAEHPDHGTFRNIAVDQSGNAWIATTDGGLLRYVVDDNVLIDSGVELGSPLRASTTPDENGVIFGVTQDPFNLFSFQPDGTVTPLGNAPAYTTSVALSPDQTEVFFVPDAHGHAQDRGTPLMAFDTTTGTQRTVVLLNELAEREFGLTLGGSYSVVVDEERERVYIGMNAGTSSDEPWGEVVFIIVEL